MLRFFILTDEEQAQFLSLSENQTQLHIVLQGDFFPSWHPVVFLHFLTFTNSCFWQIKDFKLIFHSNMQIPKITPEDYTVHSCVNFSFIILTLTFNSYKVVISFYLNEQNCFISVMLTIIDSVYEWYII